MRERVDSREELAFRSNRRGCCGRWPIKSPFQGFGKVLDRPAAGPGLHLLCAQPSLLPGSIGLRNRLEAQAVMFLREIESHGSLARGVSCNFIKTRLSPHLVVLISTPMDSSLFVEISMEKLAGRNPGKNFLLFCFRPNTAHSTQQCF